MTTALAYSMRTAVEATGLSKSHLDRAIHAGQLKAKRTSQDEDGNPTGNWVILARDLEAYLDGLPSG